MKKLPPDMELFRQSLGGVVKELPKIPDPPASPPATDFAALLDEQPVIPHTGPAPLRVTSASTLLELRLNQGVGIDRANFDRLRAGEWGIDARLDLHGLTQEQALAALQRFITAQQKAGARCVLVITGKGSTRDSDDIFAQSGVLRKQFLPWLNRADLRPKILAVCTAQPRHGGAGAFYVLLKKTDRV